MAIFQMSFPKTGKDYFLDYQVGLSFEKRQSVSRKGCLSQAILGKESRCERQASQRKVSVTETTKDNCQKSANASEMSEMYYSVLGKPV